MDSNKVLGNAYRYDGRNKLSLSKFKAKSLHTSPTGTLIARKIINDNIDDVVYSEETGLRTPGSILKRVRRPGKENQGPDDCTPDLNNSNKTNKKVRFVSPDGHKRLVPLKVSNPTPHVNKVDCKRNNILAKNLEHDYEYQSPYRESNYNRSSCDNVQIGKFVKHRDDVLPQKGITTEESSESEIDVPEPSLVKKRRRNRKGFEHWIHMRFQPKILSDTIRTLSSTQRSWVKETGFGSLLSFKMENHPQALGYYLALHLNPDSPSMCFQNISIPISDDDVNEVLGLPKGANSLIFMKNPDIVERWRNQFISAKRVGWKITANMVSDAIKQSSIADIMFKLNFLVLMSNILIEGPKNPYVKQTMLDFAGDIDDCSRYNWCQFLISNLVRAEKSWIVDPETKRYTGSLPFLVYFYMDRVVRGKRQVRRKKPTYIGWSDHLIIDRQKSDIANKTMFHGKIALPLRSKDSDDESSFEDNTWNRIDDVSDDGEEVEGKYLNVASKGSLISKSGEAHVIQNQKPSPVNIVDTDIPDAQVSWDVVDQFRDSLDEFESLQKKCMMYLLSAKKLFGDNLIYLTLETRFSELVNFSADFVSKHLNDKLKKKSESDDDVRTKSGTYKRHMLSTTVGYSEKRFSVDDFNDDLNLSVEEWDMIDSVSICSSGQNITPASVFNSMESQSKTLSILKSNRNGSLKTPVGDSVFKVQLDAEIPKFDLGVDDTMIHKDVPIQMPVRPLREKRITEVLKSPFRERITPINGKGYKKEELDLWNWLHLNGDNPDRVLFSWNNVTCWKVDFQSMNDGEMVLTSVFDVFSVYLNSEEKFRSATSPRRLFCYTETTLGTLVGYNEKTSQKKYGIFSENMDHIFQTYRLSLNEVDMVFFPIHDVNHYYVVCFNLKNPSIDILDNRHEEKSDVRKLYGQKLANLKKQMLAYLKVKGYVRYKELELIVPRRLTMVWQTINNGLDCAIYAMRHMETYFGGGARTWDSKFAVESNTQQNQISKLRLLYTYKMISTSLNKLYGDILEEIKSSSPFTI